MNDPGCLNVVTYNIHKGMSQFNRRLVVHEIREGLRQLGADVALLQEVQGKHDRQAQRHEGWPEVGQHEFFAHEGSHSVYGMNAVYQHGHHGNAVVSRHRIASWDNIDVSHHPLESRGLLHCEIDVPGWKHPLHCINVHLGLWARSRRVQLEWLVDRINAAVPSSCPIIVAGDFNDWRHRASSILERRLGMTEVSLARFGRAARTFPAMMPVLRLDRIYVRGFKVVASQVHRGRPWSMLSDHLAVSAELERV